MTERNFYSIEDKNVKWFIIHLVIVIGLSIIIGMNIITDNIIMIIIGILLIFHSTFWILFLMGVIAVGNSREKRTFHEKHSTEKVEH